MVEEHTAAGLRLNQPAGHLEAGETLLEAVIRETLEETAHPFTPEALVGMYMTHFERPDNGGVTYLRFTYCGVGGEPKQSARSIPTSFEPLWMSAPTNCAPAPKGTARRSSCNVSTITWQAGVSRSISCHTHSVGPKEVAVRMQAASGHFHDP